MNNTNNQSVYLRVLPAQKRQTKSGKTMWTQAVQLDQDSAVSVVDERRYFEEDRVLAPGLYTSAQTYYEVFITTNDGFRNKRIAVAFRDFQPSK